MNSINIELYSLVLLLLVIDLMAYYYVFNYNVQANKKQIKDIYYFLAVFICTSNLYFIRKSII